MKETVSLISAAGARRLLGVSERTLRNYVKGRGMTEYLVDRRLYLDRSAVRQILAEGVVDRRCRTTRRRIGGSKR